MSDELRERLAEVAWDTETGTQGDWQTFKTITAGKHVEIDEQYAMIDAILAEIRAQGKVIVDEELAEHGRARMATLERIRQDIKADKEWVEDQFKAAEEKP